MHNLFVKLGSRPCPGQLQMTSRSFRFSVILRSQVWLILCIENDVVQFLGSIINIDDIVREANKIFLEDMSQQGGFCCSLKPGGCGGEMGVCLEFYDSAPSGPYGTMSYLVRASCSVVNTIPAEGHIDCSLM